MSVLIPTLIVQYQYDFNGRPNRRVCWVGVLKDWRKEWRSGLKRKYKKYGMNQEALEHVLNQLVREQWENLITHWSSDKTKEISKKNSDNRKKKDMNHHIGSMAYARFREQMKNMEPNWKGNPSPFEVSCAANEPNSDAEDAEEVKDKLTQMKGYVHAQQAQGSEMDTPPNKSEIKAKAMALVLVPGKYDWV